MVRTNKERKLQLNSDLFVCSTGRGRSFDCQHNLELPGKKGTSLKNSSSQTGLSVAMSVRDCLD